MRILIAALHVPTGRERRGGVQSWIWTIRAELERLGHECAEWEPGLHDPTGWFDIGIFANMSETGHMKRMCGRTVCVSHGIIDLERPGATDNVLFVSEGVRDHWGGTGGIIRQPVDLSFWKPAGAQRCGVVRYTYRRTETYCKSVAKALGMSYSHVRSASYENAHAALSRAALVFASGRAALEAMACGAPTVIYDNREYQGPLTDDCLPRQIRNSYSGRGGIVPTLNDLLDAAGRAIEAGSKRAWIEKHHDVRQVVKELLE